MDKKPIRCYYPGDFVLPNKYDLQKAQWLARKMHEVSEVIIVIGKDVKGEIPSKLKRDIWKEMLRYSSGEPIDVDMSDKYSPLTAIYKQHEGDVNSPFAIALDRDIAEDETVQTTFEAFPNYEIILLPTSPKSNLSKEMVSAVESDDFNTFSAGLPPEMTKDIKRKLFGLIKANMPQLKPSNDDEPPVQDATTNEWWDRNLKPLYNKFGLSKI